MVHAQTGRGKTAAPVRSSTHRTPAGVTREQATARDLVPLIARLERWSGEADASSAAVLDKIAGHLKDAYAELWTVAEAKELAGD